MGQHRQQSRRRRNSALRLRRASTRDSTERPTLGDLRPPPLGCRCFGSVRELTRARVPEMITSTEFVLVQHRDHVDAGRAYADRDELAPAIRFKIPNLVVDDVAARLPERLSRLDLVRLLTLELEPDAALKDVAENRARVAVRTGSSIPRRKLNQLGHRVRPLRNRGRGRVEKVSDLEISDGQHGGNCMAAMDPKVVHFTTISGVHFGAGGSWQEANERIE
jgi:hypothetical protein